MNILMVTNNYTPYSGGVVTSIRTTVDELRQRGHNVHIVTLDFVGSDVEEGTSRISCPIRFSYKNNPMAIPWRSKEILSSIISDFKPDIIHSHHPFLLGSVAVATARKFDVPLIFTHHTLYDKYVHYAPLPQILTRPLVSRWVVYYCNNVDAIIAPSTAVQTQLIAADIRKPIAVIPSGLLQQFACDTFEPKKPIDNSIELVTVSRFVPEKNIIFLLDVIKLLDNRYKLTLLGFGAELENLKNYAYNFLSLSPDRVKFIEKPDKSQLAVWYKEADLFVFASQTETQGLVVAEAMAAGTPVIALNGPGVEDCIINNYNGFLIHSREDMAEKINLVINNRDLHKKLQEGAFATAHNYRSETLVRKLENFYQKLI